MDNVQALVNRGFQHILLLTGEAQKTVEMAYFERVLPLIRPHVSQLGMEVQPLEEADYSRLIACGLDAVTVYQETYHKDHYLMHHLSGKKRRFEYRLDTADRAARAGVYRINIGALLGLSDWRLEAIALVDHLKYLYKMYWQTQFSISFGLCVSVLISRFRHHIIHP
jgi:2-iminoacetate synthase